MFSPAVPGEGLSTQPADLTMTGETYVESVLTPATPVIGTPFTGVQQPDAVDTPLINSSPASSDWKRDTGPVLQKKAVTGQEHMGNTPGHRGSPESQPLLPSESTAPPAAHHVFSGPLAGSKGDELSIDVKGSREPVNVKMLFSDAGDDVSSEPRPLPQSPMLSVDAANEVDAAYEVESFSLVPGTEPGDQVVSMKEPLKSRRLFQTRLYKGKESKTGGEPSAPVVRVTIGRIDVRAVLQQPPVQAPAAVPEPVKPALSLDEYLRQRDGGER
jgi:hypothetical protein